MNKICRDNHNTSLRLLFMHLTCLLSTLDLLYYIQRKILFRATIFLYYSPCHYMWAWIHILDAPGCYERVVQAERKSALQGSGLVRTVRPCAQRRVALMPQAIATARNALLNERAAKQALALATKPRAKREARSVLCHIYQ